MTSAPLIESLGSLLIELCKKIISQKITAFIHNILILSTPDVAYSFFYPNYPTPTPISSPIISSSTTPTPTPTPTPILLLPHYYPLPCPTIYHLSYPDLLLLLTLLPFPHIFLPLSLLLIFLPHLSLYLSLLIFPNPLQLQLLPLPSCLLRAGHTPQLRQGSNHQRRLSS